MKIIFATLLMMLLGSQTVWAADNDKMSQIDVLEQEIEILVAELNSRQANLEKMQQEIADLQYEVGELEGEPLTRLAGK